MSGTPKQIRNVGWVIDLAAMCASGCGGTPQFIFSLTTTQGDVASFVAATSDPDVIAAARQELSRPEAERRLFILGPVAEGDGGHNTGWGWHFVPGEWQLTETRMDLCDADPQFVEQTLRDWVQKMGRYCPKRARLDTGR